MSADYYHILGVTQKATLDEIKKAYREKAKSLHPDVNDAQDAHEQFILLNEAYEYVLNRKTGKVYNSQKRKYTSTRKTYKSRQEWERHERDKARQRARANARKRYEQYIRSDAYKASMALEAAYTHLILLVSLFLFLCPLWGYLLFDEGGLITGFVLWALTFTEWIDLFTTRHDLGEIYESFKLLSTRPSFLTGLFIPLNLILFFTISIDALVSTYAWLFILLIPIAIAIVISLVSKSDHVLLQLKISSLCVAPLIINLFFMVNAAHTSNQQVEKYKYVLHKERVSNGTGRRPRYKSTSKVNLTGDAYANYDWMRTFMDINRLKVHNVVAYTIEEGLFGVRIVTDTRLGYTNQPSL